MRWRRRNNEWRYTLKEEHVVSIGRRGRRKKLERNENGINEKKCNESRTEDVRFVCLEPSCSGFLMC